MKAIWNEQIIAESDQTLVNEGLPTAIKSEFFKPTQIHTTCPWKGIAS